MSIAVSSTDHESRLARLRPPDEWTPAQLAVAQDAGETAFQGLLDDPGTLALMTQAQQGQVILRAIREAVAAHDREREEMATGRWNAPGVMP